MRTDRHPLLPSGSLSTVFGFLHSTRFIHVTILAESVNGEATMGQHAKRLRAFFGRHGRLVSFSGALLVLATFLVNDIVRDNLRDVVGALDSARTMHTLRNELAEMSDDLDEIHTTVDSIDDKVGNTKHGDDDDKTPAEEIVDLMDDNGAKNMRSLGDLARAYTLSKLLPDHEAINRKIDPIYNNLQALVNADESAEAAAITDTRDRLPTLKFASELTAVQVFNKDSEKAQDQAEALVKDILNSADSYTAESQKRYEKIKHFSYGLYIFGWSITLLGRLLGVDVPGTD